MMKLMQNELREVKSQHLTTMELMDVKLEQQQSTMEQVPTELKEITSQQSILADKVEQMSKELTRMKSQQSMIENMTEKLTTMESQQTITHSPSIDHNGEELDTSVTYELLLNFDSMKVFLIELLVIMS